jgi:hypothetical protein
VSVPIGAYPAPLAEPPSERPAAFAPLRTGQTVWVTDSAGRNTKGTVASASAGALTLRHRTGATTIAASDITRIDGTDSLANGLLIGTLVGGGAGGGFGAFAGSLWCEGSDGCVAFGALVIAGVGAGVGALCGAIVDSLHERPRRIYDAGTRQPGARIVVAPMLTGSAAGLGGVVRW